MKFSELDIKHDFILGKKIEISELFGKMVVIDKVIIEKSKFKDKNKSGLRMQMQLSAPPSTDVYSCFTGSDVLIGQMQQAMKLFSSDRLFPLDTFIEKSGKCITFK